MLWRWDDQKQFQKYTNFLFFIVTMISIIFRGFNFGNNSTTSSVNYVSVFIFVILSLLHMFLTWYGISSRGFPILPPIVYYYLNTCFFFLYLLLFSFMYPYSYSFPNFFIFCIPYHAIEIGIDKTSKGRIQFFTCRMCRFSIHQRASLLFHRIIGLRWARQRINTMFIFFERRHKLIGKT